LVDVDKNMKFYTEYSSIGAMLQEELGYDNYKDTQEIARMLQPLGGDLTFQRTTFMGAGWGVKDIKLKIDPSVATSTSTTSVNPVGGDCNSVIKQGCKNDHVRTLQTCLKCLTPDGNWGPRTQSRVALLGKGYETKGISVGEISKVCGEAASLPACPTTPVTTKTTRKKQQQTVTADVDVDVSTPDNPSDI
jgi:hypothetical protein